MTSRSAMDRPAQVTAALFGVVLIALSIVLFQIVPDDAAGPEFAITWTEAEHGNQQATLAGAGATTTLRVDVATSAFNPATPSNATVEFPSCTDAAVAPLQAAATISWALFEGASTTPIDDGTATCAARSVVRIALDAHADIGQIAADDADAAKLDVEGRTDRSTQYRLEVSWSRPAAPGGLPLPPPAFAASAKLTVLEWVAAANPVTEEAAR